MPPHRPDSYAAPPEWWQPLPASPRMEFTTWEHQLDTSPYSGRSMGAYWAYDRASGMLWVWAWNHQHFDLGTKGTPRPDADVPAP